MRRFTDPEPEPEVFEDPEKLRRMKEETTKYSKTVKAQIDDVIDNPTPKGFKPREVFGEIIDLHVLEEFIPKISPTVIKNIIRTDRRRTEQEILGTMRRKPIKIPWALIIIAGICMVGVFVFMMFPDALESLKGMFGGVV